jgi:hypothetical protein
MTRPNLSDPAELAAYRGELRNYARGWRWLGLALIIAGVMTMFIRGAQFDRLSVALIAAGWLVWIPVIVARTRYHKRRMAEPEGPGDAV